MLEVFAMHLLPLLTGGLTQTIPLPPTKVQAKSKIGLKLYYTVIIILKKKEKKQITYKHFQI